MGYEWNWGSWGQQPNAPRSPYYDAIQNTATQHGLDPSLLHAFVKIESGGNPYNRTGSYKGLLQLSDSEFAKYGGKGDIFDPQNNLTAGTLKLKAEGDQFAQKFGRQPTAAELYMMHQQGWGGAQNHWLNPSKPAWQNMYETAEGQQKGPAWARAAIWGNVPDDLKRQFGSVDNLTSADFLKLWSDKVARLTGQQPQQPQTAEAPQMQGEMNFFNPEIMRAALLQQGADPSQLQFAPQVTPPQVNPQIMTSALAMPQWSQDQPGPAPQPMAPVPNMPMQMPEQKPMGFLDRLSAALNQPMTQQGLGLFLAASQGADLNKGMTYGMMRSSEALKNQELQRQAQLRDMREAIISGWQKNPPPWMANVPEGLRGITALLGPDKAADVWGNYFLTADDRALNRRKTEAQIAQMENDNISPFDPEKGLFDKKSGRIIREPQSTGLKEFTSEAAKKAAERYAGHIKESDTSAPLALDLSRLAQLNANIGDAGKWSAWKASLGPWAKTLGVDVEGVNDLQSFQNIVTKLAPRMRPEGSGATSDYEMRQYLAALPDVSQSPEARGRVIAAMQDGIEFSRERAKLAQMAINNPARRQEVDQQIEALTKKYEDRAAARLKAGGFKTDANAANVTPEQPSQAPAQPLSPEQTQTKEAALTQIKQAKIGDERTVNGRNFVRLKEGWVDVAEMGDRLRQPDGFKPYTPPVAISPTGQKMSGQEMLVDALLRARKRLDNNHRRPMFFDGSDPLGTILEKMPR